jgi:hypothetical protein
VQLETLPFAAVHQALTPTQVNKAPTPTQVDMKAVVQATMPADCERTGINGFQVFHPSVSRLHVAGHGARLQHLRLTALLTAVGPSLMSVGLLLFATCYTNILDLTAFVSRSVATPTSVMLHALQRT